MYRIIRRTPVVIINGGGKPDVGWKSHIYGEYFSKDRAEQELNKMNMSKYDVEVEEYQSFEDQINTDYLD